ncbi:MAG: 30S ribosomal protein S9 [Chloroflexi bacterium HGW-Chloroflexi-1]|nr:MAG: 30S ribosomal protein S9 [Chloroflexi bacterium HGW-Chloroflexi-1]
MSARYYEAVGRRKTSSARVRLYPGTGTILVNERPMAEYFPRETDVLAVVRPLQVTDTASSYNVSIHVVGGGLTGQAGATAHGIARALCEADEALRPVLKRNGLLTRDARAKERKKYGLKRARKAPQYTKR